MTADKQRIPILVADDSKEDCRLMKVAFEEAKVANPLEFVHDGQALLDRLRRTEAEAPQPGLILLDLNMPKMGGQETLKVLRGDPALCHIPVLIVSTSAFHEEVMHCYRLGANSFLMKPFDYGEFVGLLAALTDYWIGKVELPLKRRPNA
jgi:CheY-like chemotaxis protein